MDTVDPPDASGIQLTGRNSQCKKISGLPMIWVNSVRWVCTTQCRINSQPGIPYKYENLLKFSNRLQNKKRLKTNRWWKTLLQTLGTHSTWTDVLLSWTHGGEPGPCLRWYNRLWRFSHGVPHPPWGAEGRWDGGLVRGKGGGEGERAGINIWSRLLSNLNLKKEKRYCSSYIYFYHFCYRSDWRDFMLIDTFMLTLIMDYSY